MNEKIKWINSFIIFNFELYRERKKKNVYDENKRKTIRQKIRMMTPTIPTTIQKKKVLNLRNNLQSLQIK